MLYVLLVGLIFELVFCYYAFKRDLFSPSAILCEVFILSTVACIYNADTWGVNLGLETLIVILGGNAVFIAVSTVIHRLFGKKHAHIENEQREDLKYIDIGFFRLLLVMVVYVIFSIIYAKTVMTILGSLTNSGDFTQAMAAFRSESFSGDVGLPDWLTKANLLLGIGVYVLLYVFINNIIVDRKKKSNYLLLIAIIAYLVSSIFTAQRTTILLAFIYIIFVAYSLLNRKYQFIQKLNIKYLFRAIVALVLFLGLFSASRGLFGRKGEVSIIDNVTYYMGNSIESLDLFIKEPLESRQFGEETLRQFRIYLSKFGLAEETTMQTSNLEFRIDANGNRAGNVYTGYRYYLHDFGLFGVLIFQIITAIFYSTWYERTRGRRLKNGIDLSLILFAWFILELFRFSMMARLFDSLAAFLFTYWYIFLFWKIFLEFKVSLRSKINENSR